MNRYSTILIILITLRGLIIIALTKNSFSESHKSYRMHYENATYLNYNSLSDLYKELNLLLSTLSLWTHKYRSCIKTLIVISDRQYILIDKNYQILLNKKKAEIENFDILS